MLTERYSSLRQQLHGVPELAAVHAEWVPRWLQPSNPVFRAVSEQPRVAGGHARRTGPNQAPGQGRMMALVTRRTRSLTSFQEPDFQEHSFSMEV
jgi:hypothetical protein